jgi:hypothetical protein
MILAVTAAVLLFGGVFAALSRWLPAGWICGWKALSGWPCAGCGGTRAILSLAAGQWADAVSLNPGVVAASIALAAANIYALIVLTFRVKPWRPHFPGWRWVAAGGLAANWIYLLAVNRS